MENERKPKFPSSIKYEVAHPIISVRLTKDFKAYLDSIVRSTGKSYPVLVREGLKNEIIYSLINSPIEDLSHQETGLLIERFEAILAELKRHQAAEVRMLRRRATDSLSLLRSE
jgi:hypothetical protein